MKFCLTIGVALLAMTAPLRADTVEVAPDVKVTKRTFAAPANEQPFFGFIDKAAELRATDDRFVSEVVQAAGSREKAFDATIQRGWMLIAKNNFVDAAKRFNQAWLLSPEQSAVYHGFAIISIARFNDAAYAEELFRTAQARPAPLKALNADYGRFLLIAKRPADARAVLEKAVVDTPDFADAWSNLGFARLQGGDAKSACAAAAEAAKLKPSSDVQRDLNMLAKQAQC
jgi:Tfp pilus assembly protein PilF